MLSSFGNFKKLHQSISVAYKEGPVCNSWRNGSQQSAGGESEPTVHPGLHTVEQSPTVHTGFFCCRRGAQWGKVEHSPTVHGGFSCCRAGLPARRAPQPLSLAAVHILTSLVCAHWHILFMNTTRLFFNATRTIFNSKWITF